MCRYERSFNALIFFFFRLGTTGGDGAPDYFQLHGVCYRHNTIKFGAREIKPYMYIINMLWCVLVRLTKIEKNKLFIFPSRRKIYYWRVNTAWLSDYWKIACAVRVHIIIIIIIIVVKHTKANGYCALAKQISPLTYPDNDNNNNKNKNKVFMKYLRNFWHCSVRVYND